MPSAETHGIIQTIQSLCIRDLRVYAQALDGKVLHYRDRNGLEIDSIVHSNDGRCSTVKVKLGTKEMKEAATHLLNCETQSVWRR